MSLTLCIQSTYNSVEVGIYKDQKQLAFQQLHKHDASGQLIVTIDQLLQDCNVTINDVARIIANNGPGPFTTLRVVITTINGISFAKRISLIGVNALDALAHEVTKKNTNNVMLLNAFGNDVYYLVDDGTTKKYGSKKINTLLAELANLYPKQSFFFAGNGAHIHQELITQTITNPVIDPTKHCSLQSIFESGKSVTKIRHQLIPVYLKDHPTMKKSN